MVIYHCYVSSPEGTNKLNRKPTCAHHIWVKIPQNQGFFLTGGPFIFFAELPMFIKFEATETRNPHRSNL